MVTAGRQFGAWLVMALAWTPALVHAQPAPAGVGGAQTIAAIAYADAYTDHPQVAGVRNQRTLTLEAREWALRDDLPADRALAVIDALGPEAARRQQLDRFVFLGIAARLVIGPSAALQPDRLLVTETTARHALLLGWARALVDAAEPARLLRRSPQLAQAGAIQLLERAAELAPGLQAAQLALAAARVAASPADCGAHTALAAAARADLAQTVRLAAAESVIHWLKVQATALPATCVLVKERATRLDAPVQLRPPLAEPGPQSGPQPGQGAGRPSRTAPSADQGQRVFGAVFVVAAPFFRGWMDEPLVRNLALRTPLDEVALATTLASDRHGDRSLAVLNASLHNRRVGVFGHADLGWRAVLRAKGLAEADEGQQGRLKVTDLTPVEALVLGYAYAIANRPATAGASALARDASPEALFAHARGGLPMDSVLGQVIAPALQVDRETVPCQAASRAEALRVVVGKATRLPVAAAAALVSALQTVEAACPTPIEPQR
jgi:hypothetical protein